MLYKYSRWPLYTYAPMRWRDWVLLPFACVALIVVMIVFDLIHRATEVSDAPIGQDTAEGDAPWK